jgi:hypothetical protein
MWGPWVAHLFHLRREHMVDVTLHEFLAMHEATKEPRG